MTASEPVQLHHPWTVADLERIPDDPNRYEIFHGSLLVTPPAFNRHNTTLYRLRRALERQAPDEFWVSTESFGIDIRDLPPDGSFYVPDLIVMPERPTRPKVKYLTPAEVLLAVEVLSDSTKARDWGLKRYDYALTGIPTYWIIDNERRTMTVFTHDGKESYVEEATVKAGEKWTSERPFPLTVDPGEFT